MLRGLLDSAPVAKSDMRVSTCVNAALIVNEVDDAVDNNDDHEDQVTDSDNPRSCLDVQYTATSAMLIERDDGHRSRLAMTMSTGGHFAS